MSLCERIKKIIVKIDGCPIYDDETLLVPTQFVDELLVVVGKAEQQIKKLEGRLERIQKWAKEKHAFYKKQFEDAPTGLFAIPSGCKLELLNLLLAVLEEESETEKILKDKKLMKLIREARKKGSKTSPYVPLKVLEEAEK